VDYLATDLVMVIYVTKVTGQVTEIAKNTLKIAETYTNMTIHWKALEEQFMMVPLVCRFDHFAFSEFF
jgi:hypothetical protein